jgi:hypothetical protein
VIENRYPRGIIADPYYPFSTTAHLVDSHDADKLFLQSCHIPEWERDEVKVYFQACTIALGGGELKPDSLTDFVAPWLDLNTRCRALCTIWAIEKTLLNLGLKSDSCAALP